jgi:hypothetical protein
VRGCKLAATIVVRNGIKRFHLAALRARHNDLQLWIKKYERNGVVLGPFVMPNKKLRCIHLVKVDNIVDQSGIAKPLLKQPAAEDPAIERPLDRQNARAVVEAFVAAALAGDRETVITLAKRDRWDRKRVSEGIEKNDQVSPRSRTPADDVGPCERRRESDGGNCHF